MLLHYESQRMSFQGWEFSSVVSMPTSEAQGPESDPPAPKKKKNPYICINLHPEETQF